MGVLVLRVVLFGVYIRPTFGFQAVYLGPGSPKSASNSRGLLSDLALGAKS